MSGEYEKVESRFRLRFSLFAVFLVVTLICFLLAWWRLGYVKRQRLLAQRNALTEYIAYTNDKLRTKWETYVAIAKDSDRLALDANGPLREVVIRDLDRLSSEILRLENQALVDKTVEEEGSETAIARRIAELQERLKAQYDSLQRRIEPSVELEMLKREIEQLQRRVDAFSRELTKVEIEIETGR